MALPGACLVLLVMESKAFARAQHVLRHRATLAGPEMVFKRQVRILLNPLYL